MDGVSIKIESDAEILQWALEGFNASSLEWQFYDDNLYGATPASDWVQVGFDALLYKDNSKELIIRGGGRLALALAESLNMPLRTTMSKKPPSVQFGELALGRRPYRSLMSSLNNVRMRMFVGFELTKDRTLARFDVRAREVKP